MRFDPRPGPPAANGLGARTAINARTYWPRYYAPYVKNGDVFDCPATNAGATSVTRTNGNDGDNCGFHYDSLPRDVGNPPLTLAELDRPADVFDRGTRTPCPARTP